MKVTSRTILQDLLDAIPKNDWQTPAFCKARDAAIRFLAAGPQKVVKIKKARKS